MTTFTRSYDVNIDAPIHEVFEYCRDPRHLFEGWPEIEVSEVSIKPDGLGTTAHIVGTFGRGLIVEEVEREFTEFAPDELIVSRAHGKLRFVGRATMEADFVGFGVSALVRAKTPKAAPVTSTETAWRPAKTTRRADRI